MASCWDYRASSLEARAILGERVAIATCVRMHRRASDRDKKNYETCRTDTKKIRNELSAAIGGGAKHL